MNPYTCFFCNNRKNGIIVTDLHSIKKYPGGTATMYHPCCHICFNQGLVLKGLEHTKEDIKRMSKALK